jgi:putative membrane protein
MRSFLIHWLFTGIALAVTAHFVPGIVVSSTAALIFGALILGLVNAVVRPVLVILTLPITLLTIGLFYLIVNGAAFALAAVLVPGFAVASFGASIVGALCVSVVSFLLNWLLGPPAPPAEWRGHPGR